MASCAGAQRAPIPPLSPRVCAGALVRSAEALEALEAGTHVSGDLLIAAPNAVDLPPLGTCGVQGTPGEIEPLPERFVENACRQLHRTGVPRHSDAARSLLGGYPWRATSASCAT